MAVENAILVVPADADGDLGGCDASEEVFREAGNVVDVQVDEIGVRSGEDIEELLKSPGVLFASTNAADWAPPDFLSRLERDVAASGRKMFQQHYVPQPPDFPITRDEPAYLKTFWLRIA